MKVGLVRSGSLKSINERNKSQEARDKKLVMKNYLTSFKQRPRPGGVLLKFPRTLDTSNQEFRNVPNLHASQELPQFRLQAGTSTPSLNKTVTGKYWQNAYKESDGSTSVTDIKTKSQYEFLRAHKAKL